MKKKGIAITTAEAAQIINATPQFVRLAMQQGKLPIGTAIQTSKIWTYNIQEKLLADYSGKDIKAELEKIRGKEEPATIIFQYQNPQKNLKER